MTCAGAGAQLWKHLRPNRCIYKNLWLLAYREAQVETFADAYLAIAVRFAIAVVMVPLRRKVEPPKAPSPAGH